MSIRRIRQVLFVALFSVALILLSQPMFASAHSGAAAAVPERVTQQVNDAQTITLSRNTRPEANALNDRGAVSDSMDVEHILLLLQRSPEQEQKLDKLINQMNDKKSPNFHHWLTAEEFGKRFGVAQHDIDAVTNWLQWHGFRINQVYASRVMIDFSGTSGQLREAFGTSIHQLDVNGERHLSNMSDPRIPAALAPVVKGIASLNDFKPHPMYKSASDYTFAGCSSLVTGPGSCYAITPLDNQTIYGLNPLYASGFSGQGQTIVLVEDTDTYGGAGDWNTYRSTFGLSTAFPLGSYSQVHPGGCADPGTNADDGEAAIDVEVASAIAPSAAIELISCASGTTTFGGLLAMQNLFNAAGPYPGIVSVSYGVCEALNGNGGNAAFYNTYQQAAAQGISVFVSSGDDGPSACSNEFGVEYDVSGEAVTGWGESPYNVSVGGTDFEDTYFSKTGGAPLSTYWSASNTATYGSALSYIPEVPWDDACANALISFVATGSFTPYGASPATCNNTNFNTTSTYLSLGAGSGGPSNCATGQEGTNSQTSAIVSPQCQGYPKPSYQSGSSLAGGQAVYGQPSDGVRDIPDVSMFAANGVWGHFETVCWSDPSQTANGAAACTGAPSTWSGFGGTSVATPTMAAIQALINQKTGQTWGNPNPMYYQIAQNQYGTAGGTFLGSGCNSSTGNTGGCAFNDVTQGDIDLACEADGTLQKAHCYLPAGTFGATSTNNITAGTVIVGGSGYTTAPACTIAGPSNNNPYKSPTGTTLWAGGTQAACTATVNAGTNTAKWTVVMQTAADAFGQQIIVGSQSYTLPSSGSTTALATALTSAINANNTVATATSSTKTVTVTAKVAGAAGNFNVSYGTAKEFNNFGIAITNTVLGEGPNYVSGITITAAGSGYQPETPITLTGAGTGAVAVANTVFSTAAQSYQPAYGAAPGYDLATGLGTPNAKNLVNSCAWLPTGVTGIDSPAASSTLGGSSATFMWCGGEAGASAYWLDVGKEQGGNEYYQSGSLPITTLSQFVNSLPTDGSTVWARLWYFVGGSWQFVDYSYTAFGGSPLKGAITSPAPNSTLTGSTVTFSWTAGSGATAYWIDVGSVAGGSQYYQSGNLGNVLTKTVSGLPTNGSTVFVTLYSFVSGSWLSNAYTYTAYSFAAQAGVLTTPTPGSTFTDSTVTFDWTAGAGASAYWLDAGSTPGGNQYYQSGNLGNVLTTTVSGLPVDGSTVYVTLYSLISGTWSGNAYTYTAVTGTGSNCLATITSPAAGSTLNALSQDFSWTPNSNPSCAGVVTAYWLDAGTSNDENFFYQSGNLGLATSNTATNLPPGQGGGQPPPDNQVQMTLWNLIGGSWIASPEVGYCGSGSSGYPACTSP
jgi:hypothetical protein